MGLSYSAKLSRYQSDQENGSLLPLMLMIFLVACLAYIVALNVFTASATKLRLERWGEDLISNLYREISYEKYFFDENSSSGSIDRVFVPVDCNSLVRNLRNSSNEFPRGVLVERFDCQYGVLKITLSEEINFPFLPESISNIHPKVVVHIGGGLQRVRGNR